MPLSTQNTIVAVFDDLRQAREAVRELSLAGFRSDQIGVVAHDADFDDADPVIEQRTRTGEGAAAGVAAGAGVGALWAIGISAGLVPAVGPIVAGGLLASVLASAAGGAAAGGILGALVGMGVPEDEARHYDDEFRAGRTIVTVRAGERYEEALTICDRRGALNAHAGRI